MWKKKTQSVFRLFFAYNAFAVLVGISLTFGAMYIGTGSFNYFNLYWLLNAGITVLEFGVLYEIFVHALKPYSGLIDLGKMIFRWAVVFLLIAATLTAFAGSGATLTKCYVLGSLMQRGLRLMECGLLMLFFLFEHRLGLPWRSRSVSIALGLGTSSAVVLSVSYLRGNFPSAQPLFDLMDPVFCLAVVSFWTVCMYLPEPSRKTVLDSPSKLIFQRWNEALMATPFAVQGAMAVDSSFLPNVEKTVDRVLARKIVH
jgi:hypothetical protein